MYDKETWFFPMIFSSHQHPCTRCFPLELLLLHHHRHKPKLHVVGFDVVIKKHFVFIIFGFVADPIFQGVWHAFMDF